jgi:hypothetical protein
LTDDNSSNIGSSFKISSPKERKDLLQKLPKGRRGDETFSLTFQGTYQAFKVDRVPIDIPLYNLKNTRTVSAQQQFLAENSNFDKGLFNDSQSIKAQKQQHIILKTLDSKSTEKNLEHNLKTQGQTDPLILDSNGVVWNGNRRLSKMRELNYFSSKLEGKFDDIKVVILPPCDETALCTLEAGLDIIKTGKEDFSWHSKSLRIRNMVQDGIPEQKIMKMRGMKKSEIHDSVSIINYVDEYLKYINQPKIYALVGDGYQAFEAIVKGIKSHKIKDGTNKMLYAKASCFSILKEVAKGTSKYLKIRDFFKAFDALYREPDNGDTEKSPITGDTITLPGTPQNPPTGGEVDKVNREKEKKRKAEIEKNRFRKKIDEVTTSLNSSLNILKLNEVKHNKEGVKEKIIEMENTIDAIKALAKIKT